MKNKKFLYAAILFLVVGFAAVSTVLYINGTLNITTNDDFEVYFSKAIFNDKVDNSVITDPTHITFTKEMKTVGEEYKLEYDVTNGSKNYDADVEINCVTGSSEYLTITNEFDDDTNLLATETRTGTLDIKLIKSFTGTEESVNITCEINANAVERTEIADGTPADKVVLVPVTAVDENGNNLNATSYEITGETKDTLLDKLVESGKVESASDVDALIEVESDDFENLADTTFDVSNIAEDGDTVVILHFNEETQEWEYINEATVEDGKVSGDFSSYSPVAFVVVKSDGTYEIFSSYFERDSWDTIASNVKLGNTSKYNVGDTKTVDVDNFGTFTVRIANKSECTNGETSETACGFVVEFTDIITNYKMNSSNSNAGSWPSSFARTYLNSTIYNYLPSDLQNAIINTTVVTGHGYSEGSNYTSSDKLYLLSPTELFKDELGTDTALDTTKQLDYYNQLDVTTSNCSQVAKKLNGVESSMWLRTPFSRTTGSYFYITASGSWSYIYAYASIGVSPAFRIG